MEQERKIENRLSTEAQAQWLESNQHQLSLLHIIHGSSCHLSSIPVIQGSSTVIQAKYYLLCKISSASFPVVVPAHATSAVLQAKKHQLSYKQSSISCPTSKAAPAVLQAEQHQLSYKQSSISCPTSKTASGVLQAQQHQLSYKQSSISCPTRKVCCGSKKNFNRHPNVLGCGAKLLSKKDVQLYLP
jgi:hypothetical protein